MTADEFEAFYAKSSGTTIEKLRARGRVVKPCACGEPDCQGWKSENWKTGATPDDVIRKLLDHCEDLLCDGWSSDGTDVTGFVRGWLGMPLPDKASENPHRLTDEHAQGVEARAEFDGAGCVEWCREILSKAGYRVS